MYLSYLLIHHVRNIQRLQLSLSPQFNVIVGANGSGKTSLLEAICLLTSGRSFRLRHTAAIINYQQANLTCFGELHNNVQEGEGTLSLGLEKDKAGNILCKINQQVCKRLSTLAQCCPLQVITPESFKLLCEGAIERRRFIDWGIFYLEPSFGGLMQRYQRLLKQRNAALRQGLAKAVIDSFVPEWITLAEEITALRQAYLQRLLPFLKEYTDALLQAVDFEIVYRPGWSAQQPTLSAALAHAWLSDVKNKTTTVGPHRADVKFSFEGHPLQTHLSRGQQKLFICALYLAQAKLLAQSTQQKCIFLIDDIASELDNDNRNLLLAQLDRLQHQSFLTTTDEHYLASLRSLPEAQLTVVHLIQGRLR